MPAIESRTFAFWTHAWGRAAGDDAKCSARWRAEWNANGDRWPNAQTRCPGCGAVRFIPKSYGLAPRFRDPATWSTEGAASFVGWFDRFAREVIAGYYSEETRCDARCENARRPNCECSCAGENHGKTFDVAVRA
jgi:hypothetical protein